MFQSSPSPKAGRIRTVRGASAGSRIVSILAQPEGRALRFDIASLGCAYRVSILAQPEGRALQAIDDPHRLARLFQSSPSPKAGRYHQRPILPPEPHGFNPRPARRPVRTAAPTTGATAMTWFQSSPSPKAGRDSPWPGSSNGRRLFQSSPSPKAGRYGVSGEQPRTDGMFQSSPSPKAGATPTTCARYGSATAVSILAQPEGRALHCGVPYRFWGTVVSILAQPEGRALTSAGAAGLRGNRVSILAQPEGRALRSLTTWNGQTTNVSILAQPEGRALLALHRQADSMEHVSILAQPEGRALPISVVE